MNTVAGIYLKAPSADKQPLNYDTITLSEAEWERFLVFLDTPDEPNAALQAAAIEYLNRFHK